MFKVGDVVTPGEQSRTIPKNRMYRVLNILPSCCNQDSWVIKINFAERCTETHCSVCHKSYPGVYYTDYLFNLHERILLKPILLPKMSKK